MRLNVPGIRSLVWPALAAFLFSGLFIIQQPGRIENDAMQYEQLSRSILQGKYELQGVATMYREPIYPLFRAIVHFFSGGDPHVVLWFQAIISVATCVIAAWVVGRIDGRWKLPVAWATALFPGYAVWSSQHYSETLSAFILVVIGWQYYRFWNEENPRSLRWQAALIGLTTGLLTLTKAAYEFLPFCIAGLFILGMKKRARYSSAIIVIVVSLLVVIPWVLRNGVQFGQYGITNRVGIAVYARAMKAQFSWKELAVSYGSELLGQSTMIRFIPGTSPIIGQQWVTPLGEETERKKAGESVYTIDADMLAHGKRIIFSSLSNVIRYVLWTPIDEMRLFGLPSPLSPGFRIEAMYNVQAKAGNLSLIKFSIVLVAHAIQILWWALIIFGGWMLIRAKLWQHPSLLLVGYTAFIYAPFDNISRYAAPVLPWIIALVVAGILYPKFGQAAVQRTNDADNAKFETAATEPLTR
jgi:hypothetical protein